MNWQNLIKKFKNFWLFAIKSFKKFVEYKGDINVFWYRNIFYYENTKHRFHLVSPSPWPLFASIAASSLLTGLLFWIHTIVIGEEFHHPLFLGFIIVCIIMFVWFRDVIREGTYLGYHTKIVQKGLKIGFILFLVSEIMFFFCLFWAYFHSSLNPSIWIGGIWPPEGIIHFYVNDSFDTLFNLFYRLDPNNLEKSRFNLTSSDTSSDLITPLKHSEHVYFPAYDPTACFDRIYLFYQNMFFYSPNGKVPLTYSFFFEKRLRENTFLAELRNDPRLTKYIARGDPDNYRIGSAFNYYYSKPLFVFNGVSSKERYLIDKYIFFMFFVKEIIKESSVYMAFLDWKLLDVSKTENFLTKKFNTIFLNLFYKFYQAPATINYWTFQNSLEKEVFLYPKIFGSDNLIFNERSLGEPFIFSWPTYFYNSSALSRASKHGLNWYLYNNPAESDLPNWSDYFVSYFNNYTFHFLDTFYNSDSISTQVKNSYNFLYENFYKFKDTSIYEKILSARFFFSSGLTRSSDYEARYFLENYDNLFDLQVMQRLKTNNLDILNNNQFLTNNLLFMHDLGFINEVNFNKIPSLENSTIKKIFAIMFKKFSRYQYMLNSLVLFFSNKNIQIQLKHFYADMDEDSYINTPKLLNFLSNGDVSLNLIMTESKFFNFGKYFKFLNTLDNNLYKDYYFESDPLIVGAKIYDKVFKCFSYKSDLYNNYDNRWFLTNVRFDKSTSKSSTFFNYDFLNKNFSSHNYALANLIIVTEAVVSPGRDEGRPSILVPTVQGIRSFYNIINCFEPGFGLFPSNREEKISTYDILLSFPLVFFDTVWFTPREPFLRLLANPNVFNNFDDEEFLNFNPSKLDWNRADQMDKNIFATFYVFSEYNKYVSSSFEFFKKLNSRSSERLELFSGFINNKLELYYDLYDVYMGGMSVYTGRFLEYPFKRFDNIYFVLSVFDKGLLIDPNKVPWLNTVILITSGLAVTVSHVYFKAGYRYLSLFFLALTIALSCFFLKIQMLEYIHAPFSMNDGIYGSVFYMLTGFHGFHVLVGTAFLTICFFRILLKHFLSSRHIAFEFAIWYWHFVDVIWIGLYFFVYYWPNNYFFYYHRIWQNSEEFTTDGFSPYLCIMQYPLYDVSDYILLNKREDFVPHLRHWGKNFKKVGLFKKENLLNHYRKLMSLCKYDQFQRQNLIASVFINHLNTFFFYNWDAYYYGERFITKKCARDYEFWWFWEDFGRYFRQEFTDYWRPWWFVLMEIFFTGKAINPWIIRRTPAPYWE